MQTNTAEHFRLFAYALAILFSLGLISLGRATFGAGQGKTSRYAEIALFFLPVIVWAMSEIRGKMSRRIALSCLWFFCMAGSFNNFAFRSIYQNFHGTQRP